MADKRAEEWDDKELEKVCMLLGNEGTKEYEVCRGGGVKGGGRRQSIKSHVLRIISFFMIQILKIAS